MPIGAGSEEKSIAGFVATAPLMKIELENCTGS